MYFGIYEYSGIQRCGKSTKLVDDAIRIIEENKPNRIISNFNVKIEGVEKYSNEAMLKEILKIKKEKQRNIVILFDELSQVLTGRGYNKEEQTTIASFLWQMPKRFIVLLYTSNVGKSVDKIIRDATWFTIMPRYIEGENREGCILDCDVIANYDIWHEEGHEVVNVEYVQEIFNTWEEIE